MKSSFVRQICLAVPGPVVVRSRETRELLHEEGNCGGTVKACSGDIYVCQRCLKTFQGRDILPAPER